MMKLLLPLLLTLALLSLAEGAEKNIVFFIADDLGANLPCYGDPSIRTPNLDAVAADGVVFRHAFCTTASCSASRSVILSGLHNHANGQYGHQHDFHHFSAFPNVARWTLPRVLAQAGYRTGHIGKLHVAPEEVFHFETYLKANPRSTVEMANATADFLKAPDPRPFFLYFATADPHRSEKNVPGPDGANLFGNLPEQRAFPGIREVFYRPAEVAVPKFLPDTATCRAELAQYAQAVSRIDQGLGRLIELLKEAGVYEQTLLVVTSDHGIAFPGAKTNVYDAGLQVPFVVRDPYAKKRGFPSEAMISHVDITPSLLDFAGGLNRELNAPRAMPAPLPKRTGPPPPEATGGLVSSYHGRSWAHILEQENPPGWDTIYASHTFHEIQTYYPMRVVRDREYKLIWNIASGLPFPFASDLWEAPTWQAQFRQGETAPYGQRTVGQYLHRPRLELYDLKADPDETRNLAEDPKYRDVLEKYIIRMKEFEKRTDDPWITKWQYE